MNRKPNLFDKIGTLIPGYKGYQEREGRRECDRKLREQISDKLAAVERNLSTLSYDTKFQNLAELDWARKKINNLRNLIQYSPYGASSFFSDSEVKQSELDKIYQLDLDVLDSIEILDTSSPLVDQSRLKMHIQRIEEAITKRNQYLKEK